MSLRNREHQKSLLHVFLEVVLIGVGVFLALLANNWHEDREHRALAVSALRNFASELRANQQALEKERQYHENLARELNQFLSSNQPLTEENFAKSVHLTGVHPINLERTAWDLALATQALSYLKPEMAFDISKVYNEQAAFQTLQSSFLASAFTPATFSSDSVKGLATAIRVYLGDVNTQEPLLLERYRKVIPVIERAIPH